MDTKKLGSAEQLRDSDIKLIRNMYGCGKYQKYFFKHFITIQSYHCLDMNYTTPPPPPCKNKISDATCNKYKGWGICTGYYENYMTLYCPLACGKC